VSLKCPSCGGNPVIYDSELSALVCPHCGTVLDEHPTPVNPARSLEEHYGSYIITRRYINTALRHMKIVHDNVTRLTQFITTRTIERIVSLVEEYCSILDLDEALCESAKERVKSAVNLMVKAYGRQLIKLEKTGKRLAAACIYISMLEHDIPVSLKSMCHRLGLRPGDIYTLIYEFRDALGYKYTSRVKLFVNRAFTALLKQLDVESASKIRDLALKIINENPQVTGSPLLMSLATIVIASRKLRVKVNVKALCESLGLSEKQIGRIYVRAKRLEQLIKA
jgi:transcription initiation factor TFIIIB Brf1 subunit/transcription initiation factor TFIIB